jgi:hypothetical protein
VLIRILATDLPGKSCGPSPSEPDGHHQICVGVQARNKPSEIDWLCSADEPSVTRALSCTATVRPGGVDVRGPHIQGRPGARFVYLSWIYRDQTGQDRMFRRAKLLLDAVPDNVFQSAVETGTLVGRLGLTDEKGNPSCASMRPPLIEWAATG